MSADRWSVCPQCGHTETDRLDSLYRTVPRAEYEKQRNIAAAYPVESLREDWEIFIRDGRFFVRYGAMCMGYEGRKACGFAFEFKHEEQVPK